MTIKVSTGLRNKVLDTGSMKSRITGMVMKIYTGAEPATADAAVTGTLLCTVSDNATGAGLSFEAAAVDGVLAKLSSQVWKGVNAATGVAGYFRLANTSDAGSASTTEERIQGSVGQAGADLNLTNTTLTNGVDQPISYFVVSQPTA